MNKSLRDKIKNAGTPIATPGTGFAKLYGNKQFIIPNGIQIAMRRLAENDNHKWKEPIIDLKATLKEKLQFLIYGKSVIIDKEDWEEEIDTLIVQTNLQEILFASEALNFDNGHSLVIIEKVGDKVHLRLADPKFPNVIRRMGRIAYEVEYWTAFKFDRAAYWKKTIVNEQEIKQEIYTAKNGSFEDREKTSIKKINKDIKSKDLQIKELMPNTFKFIPAVQISYIPTDDYSNLVLNDLAPAKRLVNLQDMLNEATFSLRRELEINTTKVFVDKDMLENDSMDELAKLATQNIYAILGDSGAADGSNKALEIQQGDPKVSAYWENITNIVSLAVQMLKLSELTEVETSTATASIFSKGNDVETVNALATFRQAKIAEIMEKVLVMSKGESFTENDLDISKWSININPNVIMNEAKITEMVVSQLSAGLINMVEAKTKVEGISKEAAKALLSQAEEFHNPSLDAISSFNEDGEEDGKVDSPINQDNNKPKPK